MNTRPVWLNGWLFVYELSGCGFQFRCSHLSSYTFPFLMLKSLLKIYMSHTYSLVHIVLPKILQKSSPKADILFGVQNFIQKTISGTFDHIDLSRISCKCSSNTQYVLVLKTYWKTVSETLQFDSYFSFQGFYAFFSVSKVFKKFESWTIWFDLYPPFGKYWSIFINSTYRKLRSK